MEASSQRAAIRTIVISSVEPEPTTAGQIKLYRHLAENQNIKLLVQHSERRFFAKKNYRHRLVSRLERTRFRKWIADSELLRSARWLDSYLPAPPSDGISNVVVTMAHGNGCSAALRYARKHGLPLVTFFDDWWPEMDCVHSPLRRVLEDRFRELYQQSQLAFCVCEGMKSNLGPHGNSHVLYPMPGKSNLRLAAQQASDKFKVFYFGNLHEYGPMMAEALKNIKGHPLIRLEVRGGNPNWPGEFRQRMQAEQMWHDYASRSELELWLSSADAFVIPMVFEPNMSRRMETSFPSKMLEMAQLGKPLIIWGPEHCSAVQWARQGNRALYITDPNPHALRRALETLITSPVEKERLAAAARAVSESEFNPDRIQARFTQLLMDLLTTQPK
jgi:glycosyltransferase involved in cell wall biosynthesis